MPSWCYGWPELWRWRSLTKLCSIKVSSLTLYWIKAFILLGCLFSLLSSVTSVAPGFLRGDGVRFSTVVTRFAVIIWAKKKKENTICLMHWWWNWIENSCTSGDYQRVIIIFFTFHQYMVHRQHSGWDLVHTRCKSTAKILWPLWFYVTQRGLKQFSLLGEEWWFRTYIFWGVRTSP